MPSAKLVDEARNDVVVPEFPGEIMAKECWQAIKRLDLSADIDVGRFDKVAQTKKRKVERQSLPGHVASVVVRTARPVEVQPASSIQLPPNRSARKSVECRAVPSQPKRAQVATPKQVSMLRLRGPGCFKRGAATAGKLGRVGRNVMAHPANATGIRKSVARVNRAFWP